MDTKITKLLAGKGENYILPFFWQHGEDEATLREYMGVIHDCGIGAVCVESRPHPDYCGDKWWTDMDIIMDEARQRGMKVWVLDDSHFPTGYANGLVTKSPDELCKVYLHYKDADVCGPQLSTQVDVAAMSKYVKSPFNSGPSFMRGNLPPREFDDDTLLTVCAMQVCGAQIDASTCIDLTANVANGQLVWDVPDGMWKIFVLYTTRNAGNGNPHYINVIDRRSCRLQIDAVYEPHFAHYAADFGKTFAGFFSDEPLFGNSQGFGFEHRIGTKMELPWSVEVPEPLSAKLGEGWLTQLPCLWYEATDPDVTAKVRYAYMDTVTRLVEEDFSNQLGQWCEEHGVEYIGHIIEDNNQHARLGQSFGHFFRGLNGQHMAGIDDIGGQVMVGGEDLNRDSSAGFFGGTRDGEFYHFALAKLGSSHAHIDPRKEGRAMCEIYGAYGWGTGVRTMKYLTDHFLVRGVNVYVPHAFSPKEYPDPDCPPHFYAHGHNPQYRHFQRLMMYMNRVCNLTNEGVHVAPVALLYHGEGEWTGNYMLLQKPARELTEHQIDFDIIPADVFVETERYQTSLGKTLKISKEEYQVVVVPYTQYITAAFAQFCVTAQKNHFKVVFVDALPDGLCDGDQTEMPDLSGCAVVPLRQLAQVLADHKVNEIEVVHPFRRLRYYHYRGEHDVYMFTNEDPGKTYTGEVIVPQQGSLYAYDAWENVLRPQRSEACEKGTRLFLEIPPYQSVIVVFDDPGDAPLLALPAASGKKQAIQGEWKLSLAKAKEYPSFHDERVITSLQNVALTNPEFSGFMRYEITFTADPSDSAVLEISDAYEGVEVWVNGSYAGLRICPPFLFDASAFVKPGENTLRIEVANTPEREVASMPKDPNNFFARLFHPSVLAPSGMVGEVNLYWK